jgi:uncharacterized transporter YbjL
MAEKDNAFFVGVKDPIDVRRNILEVAKDSIQTLQMFEKFRGIRDEKVKQVAQLKSDLREITRLLSKLKSSVPKANLRIKLHEHELMSVGEDLGVKKKKAKKGKELAVGPSPKNELQKLEEELSAIEGKLGKLS